MQTSSKKHNMTPGKAIPAERPPTPKMPQTPLPVATAKVAKGKGKMVPKVVHRSSPVKNMTALSRSSQSAKAGLQFSVPRVARFMKQGRFADRIGGGAPVYLAAALQYICSEIIELSGNEAQKSKKQRIIPRHIMLAIRNDIELNKLLGHNADFSQSGVVPKIAKEILPNNKKGKGGKMNDDEDEDMLE